MNSALTKAARVMALKGQPAPIYALIDEIIQERVGHRLLTLLITDGAEVARVYSTDLASHPVGGRKPMGPTPWGDLVLVRQQTFLGRNMDDIRWAFYDHKLIGRLGLGSIINIPIVYDGVTLGTINATHNEHHYTAEHVPFVADLAPLLIPAFLAARREAVSTR